MPINQSDLRGKNSSYSKIVENMQKTAASSCLKKSAFLCHSHMDEDLVKGLIVILEEAGVELYIDWKDHSMPNVPNSTTAKIIQDKIKTCNIFLFLATANSKASRWCPWEIGYADSGGKGIYIIPTSDGSSTYGNEYLELYPNIDAGIYNLSRQPGYFLTKPNETTGYAISNNNLI